MVQRLIWLLAVALFTGPASMAAEDATLAQIRTLLAPMRALPLEGLSGRGAMPALTTVKHKLREWIESRLREFQDDDAARAFALELNAEIRKAELSCDGTTISAEKGCPGPGYIGDVKLNFAEVLVVTTAVGIDCRFDESAYAYSFSNGRWKRFWQSETNNYVEGQYVPLNFLGILFSSQDYLRKGADPSVRLLLVLARDPAYCESNWYNVYHRVWQLRIDRPEEKLLLDKKEEAFLADWVDGSVSPNEVLVEYSTKPAFMAFDIRRVVRHYVMKSGKLEREDPLALSPHDFVDEWMRTPWDISSRWTSAGVQPAVLQKMHRKENFEGGPYATTNYREKQPEHFQVSLGWRNFDGQNMVETKHMYFLVRWLPPYRFSMAGVSERPWAGCTGEEPRTVETLFPIHLQQR